LIITLKTYTHSTIVKTIPLNANAEMEVTRTRARHQIL